MRGWEDAWKVVVVWPCTVHNETVLRRCFFFFFDSGPWRFSDAATKRDDAPISRLSGVRVNSVNKCSEKWKQTVYGCRNNIYTFY